MIKGRCCVQCVCGPSCRETGGRNARGKIIHPSAGQCTWTNPQNKLFESQQVPASAQWRRASSAGCVFCVATQRIKITCDLRDNGLRCLLFATGHVTQHAKSSGYIFLPAAVPACTRLSVRYMMLPIGLICQTRIRACRHLQSCLGCEQPNPHAVACPS